MKVLIADDEVKICQLIRHLVDWEALGLSVVDVVNDGKAAYESICRNRPDIVITDIRMPNYDGLELIRLCREKFPDTYFIIISGYSEFDYAKNAIRYGVEDYLLKPIKKKELEGALSRIREKYDSSNTAELEKERLRSMADSAKDRIRQDLLADVLRCAEEPGAVFGLEMEEANRKYQCGFRPGLFTAVIFQLYQKQGAMRRDSLDFLAGKLREIVQEQLRGCCTELLTLAREGGAACLLNTPEDGFRQAETQFHRVRTAAFSEIFSGTVLIAGVGGSHAEFGSAAACFREAKVALMNRIGRPNEHVIEYPGLVFSGRTVSDFFDVRMRSDLTAAQERMDSGSVLRCIETLRDRLEGYRTDAVLVLRCVLELAETLQFGSKNYGPSFEEFDPEEYRRKFESVLTFEELFDWIIGDAAGKYRKFTDQKKVAEKKPIRAAKQYIYDNYNRNLTLESVSGFVGFNPTYFSVLFKKETGRNFSEYLTDLRMKNAKTYLVSTDMDIADIAAEVGYGDLKYFSKLFKKSTGINPTEYRKLYG